LSFETLLVCVPLGVIAVAFTLLLTRGEDPAPRRAPKSQADEAVLLVGRCTRGLSEP
jgi:hypothetical protein